MGNGPTGSATNSPTIDKGTSALTRHQPTHASKQASEDSLAHQMQQLGLDQKQLQQEISRLKAQLERLQEGKDLNYWVLYVEDNGKRRNSSKMEVVALTLKKLWALARQLARKRRRLNIQTRVAGMEAERRRTRKFIKNKLKGAEARGELSEEELEQVLNKSEATLRNHTELLNDLPTKKNIQSAMHSLADYFAVGGSGEVSEELQQAIRKAAAHLSGKAEESFRSQPTAENFEQLMDSLGNSQMLGNQELNAEERAALKGWKPAPPGTVHTVAKGETLSQISQQYYNSPIFWDLVYIQNISKIGKDIRNLVAGTLLSIP